MPTSGLTAHHASPDLTSSVAEPEAADRARRFGGIARLYGDAALAGFERAHVAVIGIGGVGSWAAEALARSAVGTITLIDLDNVAESNTNRQIHALDGNYGKPKVEAMAERIALIDPACKVRLVEDFVEPDNFDALLGAGFDYVIDAIDSVRTKTALIAWCVARGQALVTVGGAGGQLDPTRIRIDDLALTIQDPLLSKVRAQLRKQHGFPRGPKAKFKVSAVYSDEPLIYPETAVCDIDAEAEHVSTSPGHSGPVGLNCAGFGSSVCVTASFGFAAASHVLRALARRATDAARGESLGARSVTGA
ncbi:tRNA cyclic N6-threonylcarbamoyladenosine(37) synthase TcdA [Paraburkholderia kururiensis]|uniref:tRNA cyclic N6-threonylcarbamoyladenosine(37) synthase TcdA n=1 Tax=Paraburkholderia kururiensis TaxID=984307 RepID=A0ABZ0WE87_9BURK|nr:tRNA cyclic N6-threonylcarbamoyladenosine(37) synthase TcdA [Paraburkholderia kururiensis]WQD75640.1 tRNA cyclic N6-threonylcarbamoyladenosine(37) synthase TcdA [Paraburkholderia kururiensis]